MLNMRAEVYILSNFSCSKEQIVIKIACLRCEGDIWLM